MKLSWLILAVRDWQHRPLRAAATGLGVAIALGCFASLVAFTRGYERGLRSEIDRLGAHILVVPKGCPYDAASIALHGANWPCYLRAEYLREVRAVPAVATAAPVLMTAFSNGDGTQNVWVGITSDILALKPHWHIQGHFPDGAGEVLAGAEAARMRHWQVGQRVEAPLGQDRGSTSVTGHVAGAPLGRESQPAQSAIVAGILAPTHGPDDTFVFLPLADAQHWFGHHGELTHVLVRLRDPNLLDQAVTELRGCRAGMSMNVVPLAHLFHSVQHVVNSVRLWLVCVALVASLVAAAGVSNALLMDIAERTREIGVLRALGASPADVFRLFWVKTLHLCVAGGLMGLLGAWAGSSVVEHWLRQQLPFAPTDPLLHLDWPIALGALVGAILLGAAAGLLPAWRAAMLPPVQAMRAPSLSR